MNLKKNIINFFPLFYSSSTPKRPKFGEPPFAPFRFGLVFIMAIISRFAPLVYDDFEIPSGENWDEEILEHEAQKAAYLAQKKE